MKKIRALLYCTKAKPYLFNNKEYKTYMEEQGIDEPSFITANDIQYGFVKDLLNGTIVAECEIEVEEIYYLSWMNEKLRERILKQSCLTDKQFNDYMENKDTCYALHISNLKVFDKAKELGDYYCGIPKKMNNLNGECYVNVNIDKAPQNMMYAIDDEDNEYILISIQPQWLCKILNGEKTIEVRKQVLNCMKGNG